jgi:putative flippase GtrA
VTPQFLRFLLAGGTAAAANWGSRFLFSLAMPYEAAVVCAFMVGLVTGFAIMRLWVFQQSQTTLVRQTISYLIVNLLALAQTVVISSSLARWLLPSMGIVDSAPAVAHLIGVLVPVGTSYLGHKFATFK